MVSTVPSNPIYRVFTLQSLTDQQNAKYRIYRGVVIREVEIKTDSFDAIPYC